MESQQLSLDVYAERAYIPAGVCEYNECAVILSTESAAPVPKIRNIHLNVLLDISGSMSGERLKVAKAALQYLLDSIDDTVSISIITFESRVETITNGYERATAETIEAIRYKVLTITTGGNTSMGDAMLLAFKQRMELQEPVPVEMIILTDGYSNVGTSVASASAYIVANQDQYPTVINTFSIGNGPDAKLLQSVSYNSAHGIYAHMESESEMAERLGELVANLKTMTAHNIKLNIRAGNGCRIMRTFTGAHINMTQYQKEVQTNFGNIYSEVTKSVLIVFVARAFDAIPDGEHELAQFEVTYYDMAGNEHTLTKTLSISRKTERHVIHDGVELESLKLRFAAKQLLDEFTNLCDAGHFGEARALLDRNIPIIELSKSHPALAIQIQAADILEEIAKARKAAGSKIGYNSVRNTIVSINNTHSTGRGGSYTTDTQSVEAAAATLSVYKYSN